MFEALKEIKHMIKDNKIKEIQVISLEVKSSNWDQSTVLIKVFDEAGRCGIGESDGPTEAVKAYLEMKTAHGWQKNINEILKGKDPIEFVSNYNAMYNSQIWVGRRGLGLMAISGIDMALYDLAGKQYNIPAYKLLGGAQREKATPYATLYPSIDVNSPNDILLEEYKRLIEKAKKLKFRAVKFAIMPNEYMNDRELVKFIYKLRKELGEDIEMGVDFLYRWKDPYDALRVLNKLDDCQLFFAEAVLQHDNLEGHKFLVDKVNTRICGAEMAASRWELKEWIQKTKVAIVQPDVNRCGGLTELRKIAEYADMYGIQIAPHGWKTGISAAAGIHFNFAVTNSQYFEYLHPDLYDSSLRKDLLVKEPLLMDGVFNKPEEPGLGISINDELVESLSE